MLTSEKTDLLYKALAEFQAGIKNPKTSKLVKVKSDKRQYSYRYTPLNEIIDETKELLGKQGLGLLQSVGSAPSSTNVQALPFVVTRIIHSSGQWLESDPLYVPSANSTAQQVGSAISYARRYQLAGMLGIAADDDDDASGADGIEATITQKPRPQATPIPANASPELAEALGFAPFKTGSDMGKPMKDLSKGQLVAIFNSPKAYPATKAKAKLILQHLHGYEVNDDADEGLADEPPDSYMGFDKKVKQ